MNRGALIAEPVGLFGGNLSPVELVLSDLQMHDAGAGAGCACPGCTMPLPDLAPPGMDHESVFDGALTPVVPISPTLLAEVSFLTGVNTNGSLTTGSSSSYWNAYGGTAHKWGGPQAGSSGGNVTYYFDSASGFTATEKATFVKSFALWSAVADITFTEVAPGAGEVKLQRGAPGSGAYASTSYTRGSGFDVGHNYSGTINIDTRTAGFDLGGNPNSPVGGYGLSTVVHEIGHLIGLGHGGAYNGSVNASTQQFGPFDNRMWTTMSYIHWGTPNPKFGGSYPVTGTNWGVTEDGYLRQAPHTVMPLDILASQQLYGVAKGGPLSGGQVFGFNTNIAGPLKDFYDFSYNRKPVVTIYDSGTNNTIDLSGYTLSSTLDLRDGHFSSFNGMANNMAIAFGTVIETGIGGAGDDVLQGNARDNVLVGGGGNDRIDGGAGRDIAVYSVASTAASWTKTATGYTVRANGLGEDTLSNVEVLRFTDREVTLSVSHPEVYRFFNTKAGGHFFTTNIAERDSVITNLKQFTYEGVGYYGADVSEANVTSVYRFYNTQAGGHFFTTSIAERDSVIANLKHFNFEGTGYYASTVLQDDFQAVYRFYNTQAGGHFFTTNIAERDAVISRLPQFQFEGVGYYVPRSRAGNEEPDSVSADFLESLMADSQALPTLASQLEDTSIW